MSIWMTCWERDVLFLKQQDNCLSLKPSPPCWRSLLASLGVMLQTLACSVKSLIRHKNLTDAKVSL